MMKTKLSLLLLLIQLVAFGQSANENLRQGNKLYEQKKYDEAEVEYRKSGQKEGSLLADFNLGDALYKQERYEEATEQFSKVAAQADEDQLKAKALHNLGNSLSQQKKFKEAIDAYKNSLKINPGDEETRYNLAKTLRQLQQQQQQQQNQKNQDKQNKDDNKDQKDQQQQNQDQNDQQDKQNQDQEGNPDDKKDDNQDQQGQPDQPKDDQEEGDKPKPRPDKISREDAQRLLEALSKEEQEVQKKINEDKIKGKPIKTEKDW